MVGGNTMSLTWTAVYKDGSCLEQYNDSGKENRYVDIDRASLVKFLLSDGPNVKFVLNLGPGQRLVYRRRVAMNLGSVVTRVVHIIGWQQTVHGKSVQSINFVFEDTGLIEATDGFKEGHDWYYPIVFSEDECY
jgi:hypothetical protein